MIINKKQTVNAVERQKHNLCQCSKLIQTEYKSWHDRVRTEIYWKSCKRVVFDYPIKWNKHKFASVLGASGWNNCYRALLIDHYYRVV